MSRNVSKCLWNVFEMSPKCLEMSRNVSKCHKKCLENVQIEKGKKLVTWKKKSFLRPRCEIAVKNMLGTSDDWSMSRLSQWPSILYWRLSDFWSAAFPIGQITKNIAVYGLPLYKILTYVWIFILDERPEKEDMAKISIPHWDIVGG